VGGGRHRDAKTGEPQLSYLGRGLVLAEGTMQVGARIPRRKGTLQAGLAPMHRRLGSGRVKSSRSSGATSNTQQSRDAAAMRAVATNTAAIC